MTPFTKLVLTVLLCEMVGLVNAIFTLISVETWYPTLQKPIFTPPSWVFAPMWIFLYFLMGISLFLIWGKQKTNLKWFWVQLFLNALWPLVFFGLRNPIAAMIVILFLVVSIFFTIQVFTKINRIAAYLLYPYIVWVGYAAILNGAIVILNR